MSANQQLQMAEISASGPAPGQEILPTADVAAGTWTVAPLWSKVDEPRSSPNTGDSISQTDVTASIAAVLSFPVTGGSVNKIQVYFYGVAGGAMSLNVAVSQDNATYTSDSAVACDGTTVERSATFTGLTYPTPSILYVRIDGSGNTFQSLAIYQLSIVINT